jgi:DNA-binding CsgD family transcriptional regulator
MSSFSSVIERYSIKNQAKTLKVCKPLFEAFGLNSFFYQIIINNTHYGLIGTHSDYYYEYFDQNLQLNNPFLTQCDQLKSGLYLMDSVKHPEFQYDLNKLGAKYKTKSSCMWVRKQPSMCFQAGFGYPIHHRDGETLLVNQKGLLDLFLIHFEKEMYSVLNEIYYEANQLLHPHVFPSNCKQLPLIEVDEVKKAKFLNQMKSQTNHSSYPILSGRQIDCLKYYVKGKTATQIAENLKLSKRTIEHYLESIKMKFNCERKSELIAKLLEARELGLYSEIFNQ